MICAARGLFRTRSRLSLLRIIQRRSRLGPLRFETWRIVSNPRLRRRLHLLVVGLSRRLCRAHSRRERLLRRQSDRRRLARIEPT
ncbi:hypothetical protein BZM26_33175 [Paraburkholderia strydomiana]|nr:hypothetical protein BZM26_33175 [Paraburkholderia strydomiana]